MHVNKHLIAWKRKLKWCPNYIQLWPNGAVQLHSYQCNATSIQHFMYVHCRESLYFPLHYDFASTFLLMKLLHFVLPLKLSLLVARAINVLHIHSFHNFCFFLLLCMSSISYFKNMLDIYNTIMYYLHYLNLIDNSSFQS